MCRLLLVSHPQGIDPAPHLEAFKTLSRDSQEYQGHGWGCAWLDAQNRWQFYHNINPVWEDPKTDFPRTRLFLVHARSAFRDEGIVIENNMPFTDGRQVFLFNGELRGVKIKAEGRIGAEKIFNYIKRFDKGEMAEATRKGVEIINKRTRYIRAMNFFLASPESVQVCSQFGEDPDYFQLRQTKFQGAQIICSQEYNLLDPLWRDQSWDRIDNHHLQTMTLTS